MDERTRQLSVRGVRLFERRVGSGPETVVLHGGPGAHHDYLLPGFDRLARGRTLVYYDQRGGGRSPVDRDVPVGWREQVADLEALREAWGQERLTLAGYSWGGLLAVLYALEHPDRVDSLALVAAAPVWHEARLELERRLAERNEAPPVRAARAALRNSDLRERDPEAYRRQAFALSVAGYFHDWTRSRELTPFRITGRTQQAVWDSLGRYDLRAQLRGLAVRARVVHGDDDVIPLAAAETLAELLGATLVTIPACGHASHVEQPDRLVAALDPFLPAAAA